MTPTHRETVSEADPGVSPARPAPALDVVDLHVGFATRVGQVQAVSGVSLRVGAGRTLGVVGESGSGKSVLAKAIMNILPSNAVVAGRSGIAVNGLDARTLTKEQRKHFWGTEAAMIFQDPMTSLTPVMTVGQQLIEGLRFHLGLGKQAARDRAVELLQEVGIPDPVKRLDQYPHNLSGGMRQRIVIALAISCRPKLLIADEPTTALDVTIQHQVLGLLDRLKRDSGMGIVLITHDLAVVAGRADDIAVMYAGQVVEYGPARRLFANGRHPYTGLLLGAIPRLHSPSHTRLATIPGRPPVLVDPPAGCRFADRCPLAQPKCRAETPQLQAEPGSQHLVACHYPLTGSAAVGAAGPGSRQKENS